MKATMPHTSPAQPSKRSRPAHRSRWVPAAAAVLASALALAACSGPVPGVPSSSATQSNQPAPAASSTEAGTAVPAGLESYYTQSPKWSSCHGGFECAKVSAPLDYAHPEADKIDLAVIRSKASKQKLGSLLINPGGPGGSGIGFLSGGGSMMLSADLKASYDVVSFDPRGVGESTAVRCFSDAQRDKSRATATVADTDAKAAAALKEAKTYSEACAANSPKGLLEHVDTPSSARDLDLLRAVLGDSKLNYLGYSYGTKLGATYAELFPANVGRLVLDGAMDPSLNVESVSADQAKAFERALDLYLKNCLAGSDCAFEGSVKEARAQLTEWVRGLESHPMELSDGRVLTAFDAVQAILLPLYEPLLDANLSKALTAAIHDGDGGELMFLADQSVDRDPQGKYTNTNDAFTAINCLDYDRGNGNAASIVNQGKKATELAPFFGRYIGYDDACSQWSAKPVDQPHAIKGAPSLAPILIVGTTGDPATPYPWSESLQKQLPNSTLLTWVGEGHTAYGRANDCVTQAVDGYFLKGKMPASGTRC